MQSKNLKRHLGTVAVIAVALVGTSLSTACTQSHMTGGLIGGAAVGGAYEYHNKRAIDRLKRQRANGSISAHEYRRRRHEIEDRSLIY